jgi:hypothetical protein
MDNYKLVSYTVQWSQPYSMEATMCKLQEQLEESLIEHSDLSEARQVLDRIRSKL